MVFPMKKSWKALAPAFVLLAGTALIFWGMRDSGEYHIKEALSLGRYHKYDPLVRQAAERHGVPPELIKAVIWRESRFHPDKVGTHGERGLMQITENAAADWARAEKIETFLPTDLFDPKVNIEVGSWYLKRALDHWSTRDNAVPFALAEYNAGRTRVRRWVRESGLGEAAEATDMQTAMDFPATRRYIQSIMARRDFYAERGEFAE